MEVNIDARVFSYLPSAVKGLPATEQEALIGEPYLTSTLPHCGEWKSSSTADSYRWRHENREVLVDHT